MTNSFLMLTVLTVLSLSFAVCDKSVLDPARDPALDPALARDEPIVSEHARRLLAAKESDEKEKLLAAGIDDKTAEHASKLLAAAASLRPKFKFYPSILTAIDSAHKIVTGKLEAENPEAVVALTTALTIAKKAKVNHLDHALEMIQKAMIFRGKPIIRNALLADNVLELDRKKAGKTAEQALILLTARRFRLGLFRQSSYSFIRVAIVSASKIVAGFSSKEDSVAVQALTLPQNAELLEIALDTAKKAISQAAANVLKTLRDSLDGETAHQAATLLAWDHLPENLRPTLPPSILAAIKSAHQIVIGKPGEVKPEAVVALTTSLTIAKNAKVLGNALEMANNVIEMAKKFNKGMPMLFWKMTKGQEVQNKESSVTATNLDTSQANADDFSSAGDSSHSSLLLSIGIGAGALVVVAAAALVVFKLRRTEKPEGHELETRAAKV